MSISLPIVNAREATFECIFGRGCDGICCRNGRPGVESEEQTRIEQNLKKFLPEMRPEARALVERSGAVSGRKKGGLPMLRVAAGWCVFFHEGCVLHKVGAREGDAFRYKPLPCALFPLTRHGEGGWFVRQWGYYGEQWDLFCLNPEASRRKAVKSMRDEIALAERIDREGIEHRSI